jgi:hypothetical protein
MSGPGRPTLYKPGHASRACMFWLRNRRPEDWRAKAETTPEVFADDIALLDAASESVRHAGD